MKVADLVKKLQEPRARIISACQSTPTTDVMTDKELSDAANVSLGEIKHFAADLGSLQPFTHEVLYDPTPATKYRVWGNAEVITVIRDLDIAREPEVKTVTAAISDMAAQLVRRP